MILKRQRIVGQEIVIGNQDDKFDTLGPKLELVDCHVIVMRPSLLTLAGLKMQRGCFEIRKKLSNERFTHAVFEDVRFVGEFFGCDFGSFPDVFSPDGPRVGGLTHCDFSQAILSGCRIMNVVDIDGCVFPGWPTALVTEPRKHASEIMSIAWPGEWNIVAQVMADAPDWCSAVVLNVDHSRKKYGGEDQELRQIVRAHSFMRTREW